MKATRAEHCHRLEQIPNIGPALAADLRILGLLTPAALVGQDPYALYERLARLTGQRQDPCVLDTFIAATRFMAGDPARPWWHYTPERKRALARRPAGLPDAASAARPPAAGPPRPARQEPLQRLRVLLARFGRHARRTPARTTRHSSA